jgi:hypothetical protein
MSARPSYRDEIAAEIIARIEAGTAPWQKPWAAGVVGAAPFNPVSGKPYRGINDVGRDKAAAAAQAVGGTVLSPRFTAGEKARGLTDFNDFAQARGAAALKREIEAGLALARAPQRGVG